MSKRHAVYNKDGQVVNVIVWDGESPWYPPAGHGVVQHDHCDIGDTWDMDKKELIKPCRIHKCDFLKHVDGEPCVDFTRAEKAE